MLLGETVFFQSVMSVYMPMKDLVSEKKTERLSRE